MGDKTSVPKKFQTRAGISRKTKEDREQYAREEAARQQQRLAEAAQIPINNAPDKGRSAGRGRLANLSNSSNRIRSEKTAGVFGAAVPSLPKQKGGQPVNAVSVASDEVEQTTQPDSSTVVASSASEKKTKGKAAVLGDESGVKTEKRAVRARVTASRVDEAVYVSSEDDVEEVARRDIEQIWISSDEGPMPARVKGKQKEMHTVRHGTALRPLRAPRDSRGEGEALSARNRILSTIAKGETSLGGEDAKRGPLAKEDHAMEPGDRLLPVSLGEPDKKSSKRKGGRLKDAVAVSETLEEHAERLRYNEDIRKLLGEFRDHQPTQQAGAVQEESDDGVPDRRLFLFQFPPMTPVLGDPADEAEVKQEAEVEGLPIPSAAEKTDGLGAVKKEEEIEENRKKSDVLTADNMQLPGGLAGTLRLHKSGKVTLDWGGVDMEVRYGTEVDFLQDVVMTDATEHTAWALGQVEKKMVCIPNWQKLYE